MYGGRVARVATPCHSCLGEKRKIEKYVFPSSMALPCLPNPLKLSNPLQTVTSSIDKSRHGKNAWVSIDLAIIGHLTFTVRRSLAQTWHLWIDCSADSNIRLTRRNVNKTQPALASSDATCYTKLPSSDRMVNQPTPQTCSSCRLAISPTKNPLNSECSFPNEVLANENLLLSPILVLPWLYWAESIKTPRPTSELWSHRRAGKTLHWRQVTQVVYLNDRF